MTDKERILSYLSANNGVVSAKAVRQMGLDTKTLQRLANNGVLERVAHGLYMDADQLDDPFFVAQYRCPQGVYSMDSALFLHHLTDRNPVRMTFTIPSKSNTGLLNEPERYRFYYLKNGLWNLGQTTVTSPYDNPLTVYDIERTICDCIRKSDDLDRNEMILALKAYFKTPGARFNVLLDYADAFRIRDTIRQYMEVLR